MPKQRWWLTHRNIAPVTSIFSTLTLGAQLWRAWLYKGTLARPWARILADKPTGDFNRRMFGQWRTSKGVCPGSSETLGIGRVSNALCSLNI